MIGKKKTILHHRWFEKYNREEQIWLSIRSVSFIIFWLQECYLYPEIYMITYSQCSNL